MKKATVAKSDEMKGLLEKRTQLAASMPGLRDSFDVFQQQYTEYLKRSQEFNTSSSGEAAVLRKVYSAG